VRRAADWTVAANGFEPCPVPEAAFAPLYSTWYAFMQDVHADVLEREMKLAHALGMRTAILDDGWQKQQSTTFYSKTGDWLPVASRFPDMKRHVDAVHAAGMRYMLWYSVPFVGEESATWKTFEGKFLNVDGQKSPERAARPILNSLFAVIQYSMILDGLPEAHRAVIRRWLDFSQQHRATLLKGVFRPYHPELLYPRIEAESAAERLVALYSTPSAVAFDGRKPLVIVNATFETAVPLRLSRPATVRTYDVFGACVKTAELAAGDVFLDIPVSGHAELADTPGY